jgi:hypothetical protein
VDRSHVAETNDAETDFVHVESETERRGVCGARRTAKGLDAARGMSSRGSAG